MHRYLIVNELHFKIAKRILHCGALMGLCGISSLRGASPTPPMPSAPSASPTPPAVPTATTSTTPPGSPEEPLTGPGGREIRHAAVMAESHGAGAQGYWLFEPAQPAPDKAPLIVFNHGWAAMDPRIYQAWINHLVERGNIVVFPNYQDSILTLPKDFTPNAVTAVRDAIHTLQNVPGHVKPQMDKFAIVGHSMGGVISANMASLCKAQGLPAPCAVMCVEPGKTWGGPPWATIQLEDLSQIPSNTLLLTVTGDQDQLVGDTDAKKIFKESTQVLPANKNYVTLVSDDHGLPALKANHMAPVAFAPLPGEKQQAVSGQGDLATAKPQQGSNESDTARGGLDFFGITGRTIDALDYYGTWKLLDGLTDAAFYGKNRNYALGNTQQQRFMGTWSDGVPVKELRVTEKP